MTSTERLVVDGIARLPQFAHAGIADGWIMVSGTLGTVETGMLIEGGVGNQTVRCLENIAGILKAASASWDDVLKVNVYLADMADYEEMNAAYLGYFADVPPARMGVGGVHLALGAKVEIDCVAKRSEGAPVS
ncbi:MAG TPA: RidA family protein [Kribbella sp.]|uniref:RidA family protein n=1 Tax=Kribbella sp. TaxID=1871183 RepID=UPI002D77AA86|nr:RidA family protein [Kribbella sp.]HET6295253.1 RidA family protein [Kribbella sp.]